MTTIGMESLAPAALAAALLYAMYAFTKGDEKKLVKADSGTAHGDNEMKAQLTSGGIPTHMLVRSFGYAAGRNYAGSGEENSYNRYRGPEGIVDYAATAIQGLKEVYAREIFNDRTVTFQIPAPTIKPTLVYYKGGPMPGVSTNYVYSQIEPTIVPKIGRAEDRW